MMNTALWVLLADSGGGTELEKTMMSAHPA